LRGFALAAPAARAEADRITNYTQQSKFVNGRAFFQNGNNGLMRPRTTLASGSVQEKGAAVYEF